MGQINYHKKSNTLNRSFENKKIDDKKDLNCVNDQFRNWQESIDNDEIAEPSDEEIISCDNFEEDDEEWEIPYDQQDTHELMLNFQENKHDDW